MLPGQLAEPRRGGRSFFPGVTRNFVPQNASQPNLAGQLWRTSLRGPHTCPFENASRFQSSEQSSIRNSAREGTNSINRVIKRRNDTPQKPRGNLRRKICAAQITLSVPGNKSSLIPSLVTAGWQRQFPAKNYHKIHGGHRHAHATSR